MAGPFSSETVNLLRAGARHVDVFISVSEYYAGLMAGMMQVPREKIRVVPLGVKPEGFGLKGERKTDPFTVGYLGRVSPEKGLHILCEAFHELTRMPGGENAGLRVAGWMGAQHRAYLEENEAKMRQWGTGRRFECVGRVSLQEKVRVRE